MRALLLVACFLASFAAAQTWQRFPATAHPPVDAHVAMAFDPLRQRTVCCATETLVATPWFSSGRTTTWEWDGASWAERATATTLPSVARPIAMTFDAARRCVVLANGDGELWQFDGADWSLAFDGAAGLRAPSLAFDPVRNVLVCADSGALFEESNGTWVPRASFGPGAIEGTQIAFDAANGRIVAFGGLGLGSTTSATWSWDGVTLQTLTPPTSPAPRTDHTLVVDPVTQQLLCIGGVDYFPPQRFADVHAWNGTTWIPRPALPQPRSRCAAAPFGSEVLVFGGTIEAPSPAIVSSHELLRHVGGQWNSVPLPAPGALAAFDAARGRTVSVIDGATLESDGFGWTDVAVAPPPQLIALCGLPTTPGVLALDSFGTTWRFDGAAWTAPVLPLQPSPRDATAMAYDPVRNRVVLFGGQVGNQLLQDTWEWNGTAWTAVTPPQSPPPGRSALAWDALGQRLVLVPQPTANSSTFAWNGTTWTSIGAAPNGCVTVRLAGDPVRGLVMLATSPATFSVTEQTFLLIGNSWQALPTLDQRAITASLVYDSNRQGVVACDGSQRRAWSLTWQPAATSAAGFGCVGTNGIPQLLAASQPQLGAVVRNDVLRAAPSSLAVLVADLTAAAVPLPGGCTQFVANPLVLAVVPTTPNGFATASWTIPSDPAVRGIVVHEQALVLDPAGALSGFASVTAALQLLVGD